MRSRDLTILGLGVIAVTILVLWAIRDPAARIADIIGTWELDAVATRNYLASLPESLRRTGETRIAAWAGKRITIDATSIDGEPVGGRHELVLGGAREQFLRLHIGDRMVTVYLKPEGLVWDELDGVRLVLQRSH